MAIFYLVHVDIWGPYSVPSVNNHRYFLTILDDCSRFVWVKLMKTKGEAQGLLKEFVAMVDTQFSSKVKVIRSDNGTEFILPSYYATKWIIHQRSCVDTPQQNGRVEHKHQHILNVARGLMFQSKLPQYLWSHAI